MAQLNLTIRGDLNTSLQAGDSIYYCSVVDDQAGKNHPGTMSIDTKPKKLGVLISIDEGSTPPVLRIEMSPGLPPNPQLIGLGDSYIFFIKDGKANFSGVKGYYAEVEYKNFSTQPIEMFATSTEYTISSN